MRADRALEARILLAGSPRAPDAESLWGDADAGDLERAAALARALERRGVRALLREEDGYPEGLRDLPDAPRVVFVRGRLPVRGRAVAVVGSRAASPYGAAQAARLAADLARLGYAVVSGLARGIDGAAHRGALEAGGASVAVLPGGLDAVTPRHHEALAEALCARGGLLSERAGGPPPWRATFVERNRLIAALASATVVVEAAARSGALSTAAAARRLGRPVLAFPGDVDRETSRGTHGLLRGGALLCEGAGDVVRALEAAGAAAPRGDATPAERVRVALGAEARTVDAIAAASGLDVAGTLALLLELEWAGVARRAAGQRWLGAGP